MESHFVVTAPTELKEGSFFPFFFINRPSRGVFRDLGSKWRRKFLCNVLISKKISVNKLTVFRDLTMEGKKTQNEEHLNNSMHCSITYSCEGHNVQFSLVVLLF